MFNKHRMIQVCRKQCLAELKRIGYKDPQVYFDSLHGEYSSYWGDGDRRLEVTFEMKTSKFWIYELSFI